MLCSPAEIERKRLEALEKLSKKTGSPPKAATSVLPKNSHLQQEKLKSPFGPSGLQGGTSNFKQKPYVRPINSAGIKEQKPKIQANFYGVNKVVTATISLISAEIVSVNTSSYFSPIVETLRTIPSKSYDPPTRSWNFPIRDYDTVILKLNQLKSQNVVIEPLPRFVVNCLKSSEITSNFDFNRLDPVLFQTLLPFQVEGLRFGIQRNGRCLIADDMGLGKTFQALAIMNYYQQDWPLLIVTTASMKNVWEETIMKYMPSVSIMKIQYMVSGKDYIGDSLVLILSHELMSRCCDKLLERGYGCIIIDESHNLKNHKTKVAQAATRLCKKARRLVLLSGTPALSRPNELYPQLSLIDENFFGGFFQYAKRYCDMQQTNFGLNTSGKSNLQELELILKWHFMIRRRKDEVLGTLPNKRQEIVKLNVNLSYLDEEEKQVLESLSSQFVNTTRASEKHNILLTLFCETAKIKIPAVCSHILKVLESKVKFLVFAHHLVMLDAIEVMLKQKNQKYVRIDGHSTGEQRKYFVDKFQTDETCCCALLSITATNTGLTLTAAQQVVFAELHWNPSILNQAEARVHRIGQMKPVLIQYLLAAGTADDYIWPLLQEKQTILREMGLAKETFSDVQEKQTEPCINRLSISNNSVHAANNIDGSDNDDSVLNDGLDDLLCNINF